MLVQRKAIDLQKASAKSKTLVAAVRPHQANQKSCKYNLSGIAVTKKDSRLSDLEPF